jgi:hypothetical protein
VAVSGGIVAAIAGVIVGGVALVLVRKREAAASGTAPASPCDQLPEGQLRDACKLALGIVDKLPEVLELVPGIRASEKEGTAFFAARDEENKRLNGAVKTPLVPVDVWGNDPVSVQGAGATYRNQRGTVLEFQNGCQPFFGAPGFSKCAPGTKDMWEVAWADRPNPGLNEFKTDPAYLTMKERLASSLVTVNKNAFNSGRGGKPDPSNADPNTHGPFPDGTGGQFWVVKGKRIACPSLQAPDTLVNAERGITDNRTTSTPTCVPISGTTSPWGGSTVAPPPVVPVPSPTTSTGTRGPSGGVTVT